MTRIIRLWICLSLLAAWVSAQSLDWDQENDPLQAILIAEEESIQPGRPFWVALHLTLKEGWHTYWKNPGDAGMPISIAWSLPAGWKTTSFDWPTPIRFDQRGTVGFGYDEEAVFLAQITPHSFIQEASASITAEIQWVACSKDTCLPGTTQIALSLPIGAHPPLPKAEELSLFAKARALLPSRNTNAFSARRLGELIELSFPKSKEGFQQAYFFPEEQHSIDHQSHPVLGVADQPGYYNLILKESNAAKEHLSSLKGVLVLQSEKQAQSYAIDMPIANVTEKKELISMADAYDFPAQANLQTSTSPEFKGGVIFALGLAFIGGMILNLMPCVLPVLSFKVLSFVKMAGKSRSLTVKHGFFFTLGVLASFWILAGVLLTMQSYGKSVGWGFQLQEPLFVALLSSILFAFSLSLFGVFEIGTSLTAIAGQMECESKRKGGFCGSFLSGVLATAVATPCTGPFLGSALGFAVTLPPAQSLLIFTFLGMGMSAPYLMFALSPKLLQFMPRPGAWMVTFKELMGFFMLATVLWLVWVFAALTSSLALVFLLSAYFFLGMGGVDLR